jgi:clan AA aspartic protease
VISGSVTSLQACIEVAIRLPGRPDLRIEFVIDTGFAGALTLPAPAITALGLPFFQQIDASLADDASIKADAHLATIVWDGVETDVAVLAMGRRPLLGTALLAGYRLTADFQDGGSVSLAALP